MMEYTAFKIDRPTLEKIRVIAKSQERSMAGQVRFMVDREMESLRTLGLIGEDQQVEEDNGSSL